GQILVAGGEETSFQPEGSEDLVIAAAGALPHAVQVKAYADPLVLSDFEIDKPRSFFRRAAGVLARKAGTIEVVSFGEIGPELTAAWAGPGPARQSVRGKLVAAGVADGLVDALFAGVRWTRVTEESVAGAVDRFLRDSLAGGDPAIAFDLLTAWI